MSQPILLPVSLSVAGFTTSITFLNNSVKIIKDIKRITQNNIGTEIKLTY